MRTRERRRGKDRQRTCLCKLKSRVKKGAEDRSVHAKHMLERFLVSHK